MSALKIPPRPVSTAASRSTTPSTSPSRSEDGRPRLRLVEAPPRQRSLAPTGPLQAWRRRIGALLVLAAAVVLLTETLAGPVALLEEPVPASTATAVVEPGQTLWDVATEHAPADVGAATYVRQLAELNGIDNGAVDAWQVLRLPD